MHQNTARAGTEADAAAKGRNGHPVPGDEPAIWISGAQWADELGLDPDSPIGQELGSETWKAVRKFCRQHEIEVYYAGDHGMAFADFDALPAAILRNADPSVELTREAVVEFAEDALAEDPDVIGERMTRERSQRFRDRERVAKAGVSPDAHYTLAEVAHACGERIATEMRDAIDRRNRRAWNTARPHQLTEQPHLVSASDLAKWGVPVTTIAAMTPATAAESDAAVEALALARERHRHQQNQQAKRGDNEDADGPLYPDIGALLSEGLPEPPTPDILRRNDGVGLFYRGEINLLYGDPEDGKTMIALAACVEVLRDGGTALFVDLDDNGVESTIARLLMLGAPADALRKGQFRYCSPAGPDRMEKAVADGLADGLVPDLVVIDCVGELIPMFGGSNDSADDFTGIIRATAAPLARAGACVVLIDHLAKSTDSRNYGSGGTMAKRRRVGGTQLRVMVDEQLRKGCGGALRLGIRKDRHSGLRQHCSPASGEKNALQPAGTFIITKGDKNWHITTDPWAGPGTDLSGDHDKHHDYVKAAESLGDAWTITTLAWKVHGEKPTETQLRAASRAVQALANETPPRVEQISAHKGKQAATYRLAPIEADV